MDGTILILDDDRSIRTVLSQAFTRAGCKVRATNNCTTLLKWVNEGEGHVVLSDVVLPDGDGIDLLPQLLKSRSDLPVIIMSAQNTVLTAVRSSKAGAFDYIPKPFDLRNVLATVNRALSTHKTECYPKGNLQDLSLPMVGGSAPMQEIYKTIAKLVHSNANILIKGATGSGKRLLARVLHQYGPRSHKPFITLQLAGMDEKTILAELLGENGKLASAQDGILFLDRMDEASFEVQQILQRVLQQDEQVRNSNNDNTIMDIQLIAATDESIDQQLAQQKFNSDLYFLLNIVPISVPSLQDRSDDIPLLVEHFKAGLGGGHGDAPEFSSDALQLLCEQTWTGNIRELKNLIERISILSSESLITRDALALELKMRPTSVSINKRGDEDLSQLVWDYLEPKFNANSQIKEGEVYATIIRDVERPLIELALRASGGNQLKCANLLGINRNTLRKKINDLDISVTRDHNVM